MKKLTLLSVCSLLILSGAGSAIAQDVEKVNEGENKSKEIKVSTVENVKGSAGAFLLKKSLVDVPNKSTKTLEKDSSQSNEQSVMVTYILKNLTTEPLSALKLNIKTERKDVKLQSTTCNQSLGAHESCNINITYIPKHSKTAEIFVTSSTMQLPVESMID